MRKLYTLHYWEGADEIYPKEWVYADATAAAKGINAGPSVQAQMAQFAKVNFDIHVIAKKVTEIS